MFIAFGIQTANAQALSPYAEALSALKENKTSLAYEILESIPETDSNFIPALAELQKLHYKQQDWSKFFAYSIFYRQKFLQEKHKWNTNFNAQLLTLEALALGKHCRWEEAYSIVNYGLSVANQIQSPGSLPTPSKDTKDLKLVLIFLPPLKTYPRTQTPTQEGEIPHSIFRSLKYWPMDTRMLSSIAHPKYLRFRLESKCSK